MKAYTSLFKTHRDQPVDEAFAHFYAINGDYDEPFALVARQTVDGVDAWHFQQQRFKDKYAKQGYPKLRNYLNYTFKRLVELEKQEPGRFSSNLRMITGSPSTPASRTLTVPTLWPCFRDISRKQVFRIGLRPIGSLRGAILRQTAHTRATSGPISLILLGIQRTVGISSSIRNTAWTVKCSTICSTEPRNAQECRTSLMT